MSSTPTPAAPGSRLSAPLQFWIVLLVTLGLASVSSWATARWMGFRFTSQEPFDYGSPKAPTRVFVASSSLGYFGLDWSAIAARQNWYIRRYDIPAASPCEFENTQALVPDAKASILVVSMFDLDETYFSDYRAALVPMGLTIEDLRTSGVDWAFAKRTLSQYPEHWVKAAFPTAGASMGVMVGIRSKLAALRQGHGGDPDAEKPVLNGAETQFPTTRVSEWDEGRLLRNSANIIADAQGRHFFTGPKHEALRRVLTRAQERGPVFVVVMPVTPEYRRLVANSRVLADFNTSVAALAGEFPQAHWVRLDQLPALDDSQYFWDLVHLNVYGRAIATGELENVLSKTLPAP